MGIIVRAAKIKKNFLVLLRKNRVDAGILCLLFVLGVATRAPLVERYNSHWDGAQFSMAVISYDISQNRPSPPGYPLYIFLGKIVHVIVSNPHTSLLVVNVLVSAFGIAVFYYVGSKIFNRWVAILASMFFFSGAVFYYFGITTYGYGLVPIFSTLFAYSIYRIVVQKKKEWLLSGILFAITFGVRPQEIVSVLPLLIFGSLFLTRKNMLYLYLISAVGTLVWLVPVVMDTGNVLNFVKLNMAAIRTGGFENTTDTHELTRRILQGIYLTVGIGVLFLTYYPLYFLRKKANITGKNKKKILFFSVWFVPSFLFNVLVRSDHAGHQQVYLSSLVLIVSYAVYKIAGKRKMVFTIFVMVLVASNLWNFFRNRDPQNISTYTQTSFHYTDLLKNDTTYSEKIAFISSNFNPRNTVLFATSPMWRVTSYYLPKYQLFNIVSLETKSERFRYIIRSEKNWDSDEKSQSDFVFKVPNGIDYIVFFDTEYCFYNVANLKKAQLPKNNCVGVLRVKPGTIYSYDYRIFRLLK